MRYHPFRNLGLKVLALSLASLLWITVAGEHELERTVRVPLEFRNIPKSLEIVGPAPEAVEVRLRGSSAVLSRLQPGEIVVVLDLASARSGSRLVHIRNDEVRAPFGIEIAQVLPATLPLEIERSISRQVPVLPATQGSPAPGFVIGHVRSVPPMVEIVGPEAHVRQVENATTEPVSIAGATSPVREMATIGVGDSAVRLTQVQTADVTIGIVPAPVQVVLDHVPVRWRNLGSGLKAELAPQFASVTARGGAEILHRLAPDSVVAFVDLAGLGAGRYNLRVQTVPAADYGVTAIEPATAAVTIR